ncbi:MAG: PilZ domain-containing protein [Candidatus Aminicenantes bacterium]|nr:MAG: PilZ domain-containing protein [Candidatus Aminicenantes bacterium]HDJ24274.1 PilZ domain-containing protein [Candidatus Aminicenantes bacterium]
MKDTKKTSLPSELITEENEGTYLHLDRRREWRLELPLQVLVKGTQPNGQPFEEITVLENISSTGAYFGLDAVLTIGTPLELVIDLPPKLTEGQKIQLQLQGRVVRLEKRENKDKAQGIALHFEEEYQFVTSD